MQVLGLELPYLTISLFLATQPAGFSPTPPAVEGVELELSSLWQQAQSPFSESVFSI